MYLLAPFKSENLKIYHWSGSRVYEDASLVQAQNGQFAQKGSLSVKTYDIILMYLLARFTVQNL